MMCIQLQFRGPQAASAHGRSQQVFLAAHYTCDGSQRPFSQALGALQYGGKLRGEVSPSVPLATLLTSRPQIR